MSVRDTDTIVVKKSDLKFIIGLLNRVYEGQLVTEEDRERMSDMIDHDVNNQIREALVGLGIRQGLLGYEYLKDAIKMSYDDSIMIREMTKQLYPSVAKLHSTTASRVERAIRHSIESAFDNCTGQDWKEKVFGNTTDYNKGKPTNCHFIASVVEYLRER